jgi:hypothetical protein
MKIAYEGRRETFPLGTPNCIDKDSLTRVVPHSRIEAGLQGHAEYR